MPEDEFYIVLTIEGTLFDEVEMPISNPFMTICELLDQIIRVFELPILDSGGGFKQYLIGIQDKEGECLEILEFNDIKGRELSLADYNICQGNHLWIIEEITAGGGDATPYLPSHYEYIKKREEEIEKRRREEEWRRDHPAVSYEPFGAAKKNYSPNGRGSFLSHLLERWSLRWGIKQEVRASIFAPAETMPCSYMLVQVYLHLDEETEIVKKLAQESQWDAKRRDYIPLKCSLKKGDEVDVLLNIYTEPTYHGKSLLMSEKKSMVWQGSFTKCSFDFYVPEGDGRELCCKAMLFVKGIPIGEMCFIISVVNSPRKLNPEVVSNKYKKVFISYAHKDESKVKSFHEGLKLFKIEHFFDRDYLQAGDVFPTVIQEYIDTADLFVLFWSENASQSEYVEKERKQALKRAYPYVKPQKAAKLTIYPMSIEPCAELPSDMKHYYHFGQM